MEADRATNLTKLQGFLGKKTRDEIENRVLNAYESRDNVNGRNDANLLLAVMIDELDTRIDESKRRNLLTRLQALFSEVESDEQLYNNKGLTDDGIIKLANWATERIEDSDEVESASET